MNFSKAAEECQVTQATLSRQIRVLENEIGIELFKREKNRVQLTPGGTYLLHASRKFLEMHQDILIGCKMAEEGVETPFRIALGPYEHFLLEPMLLQFFEEFPQTQPIVNLYSYNFIASPNRKNMEDILICPKECILPGAEYETSVIYDEPWHVAARADSSFWKLPKEKQGQLYKMYVVTGTINKYELSADYCIENGLPIRGIKETTFFEAQKLMLYGQNICALFPPYVGDALPDDILLRDVLSAPLTPQIVIALRKNTFHKDAKVLYDFIRASRREQGVK